MALEEFAHKSHTAKLLPEEHEQLRGIVTGLTTRAQELVARYRVLLAMAPKAPSNETPYVKRADYWMVHAILNTDWRPATGTPIIKYKNLEKSAEWRTRFFDWRSQVEGTVLEFGLNQVTLPRWWPDGGLPLMTAIDVTARKLQRALVAQVQDEEVEVLKRPGQAKAVKRTGSRCLNEVQKKDLLESKGKRAWDKLEPSVGLSDKSLQKAANGLYLSDKSIGKIESYLDKWRKVRKVRKVSSIPAS